MLRESKKRAQRRALHLQPEVFHNALETTWTTRLRLSSLELLLKASHFNIQAMNLPPRAGPLLARLDAFVRDSTLGGLKARAAGELLGSDWLPEPEDIHWIDDYITYEFHDEAGRGAIDFVLQAQEESLTEEERTAYRKMRDSLFGLFEVVEARPEEGLRLRRIGTVRYALTTECTQRAGGIG